MDIRNKILNQCFNETSKHRRRTAAVSVGVGKTFLGLMDMEKEKKHDSNVKFLIVVPKLAVKKTWKEECIKFDKEHLLDNITFVTYRSFIKSAKDYTVIYLDEVHNIKFTHEPYLSTYKGKILGLTGSHPENDRSEKSKMITKYCPIVYIYDTDDAVKDGILNDYRIIVHSITLGKNADIPVTIKSTGKTFYQSEYKSYNYWCNRIDLAEGNASSSKMMRLMRMKALQGFKSKEIKTRQLLTQIDDKCLVFGNTTAQEDRISSYTYHSKNPNSETNLELFKEGKINELASVNQLKEGINVPNLKASIILHTYANEYNSKQRIGRLVRLPVDQLATIHILMYKDTVDEQWVESALSSYDQSKITYL